MQAVLYICHGSRVKTASNQAKNFVKEVMPKINIPLQEVCFLELADPTINEGINRLIQKGATTISVVPVLLLSAAHAKKDIPSILNQVKESHPHVSFNYGQPLGVHEKLVDTLYDRMIEKDLETENSMVLLVGRGSSDQEALRDLGKIARKLQRKHSLPYVQTCFLAASEPTLDQGLEMAKASGYNKVFVIPYLLFTGILMQSLEEKLQAFESESQSFVLCQYLGYHPNLQDVLIERTNEVIQVGEKNLTFKIS